MNQSRFTEEIFPDMSLIIKSMNHRIKNLSKQVNINSYLFKDFQRCFIDF